MLLFDPRRLVVLRAIDDHRSFTRAAETLAMTQPAVSRQLAALEREVGVALVARGPRHVSLTPAGAALAHEAATLLPAIEAAQRRIQSFADDDGGAVRVGAVPSAMASFVPGAMKALRAKRPKAEIRADENWSEDLVRLTARGELDLAIVSGVTDARGLPRQPFLREPYVVLLPSRHPLTKRTEIALTELKHEPWIQAPNPGGHRGVMGALNAVGVTPRVVATAAWDSAEALIAAGEGIALGPESAAKRLRRGSGVVSRPLKAAPQRELVLIRPPRAAQTPIERDLIALLRAEVS